MKKRAVPEVEHLEARQVPYASLSGAGISPIHYPLAEPVLTPKGPSPLTAPCPTSSVELQPLTPAEPVRTPQGSGSLTVPCPSSSVQLQPDQPRVVEDNILGRAPDSSVDLRPTSALMGKDTAGQAADKAFSSSANGLSNDALSSQEMKVGSPNPKEVDKLFPPLEHGSPGESLAIRDGKAEGVNGRPGEKYIFAVLSRLSNDPLSCQELTGAFPSSKQRERHAFAVPNRLAHDSPSFQETKGAGLGSKQRQRLLAKELEKLFSSLANGLPNGALSFQAMNGDLLNPKDVEKLFSRLEDSLANDPSSLPGMRGRSLDPVEVGKLFASLWETLRGAEHSILQKTLADEHQQTEGREGLSMPPLYLNVVLYRQPGKPLDPKAQQGLERLCAYAWKAIHNSERAHGERFLQPEDIVQEIYVEWRGLVGPKPEDEALCKLLEDQSEEMKFLRVAVRRVIGRTRYQQSQRIKMVDINGPVNESSAFAQRGEQERIDWEDLWEKVVSTLTPQQKQILELRKQGMTFAEIGSTIGMPKQRACETYHGVVARLQKNYPSW